MMESRQTKNPFPGLRPFETDEYRLFFGREGQADELLGRLQRSRLLAVVGTSGSGKSSLIRAGLLPALQGGMMTGAGSGWRIAVMRPGGDPIGNLSNELGRKEVLSEAGGGLSVDETVAVIDATLRRGSLGIVDVARQGRLGVDEKLLIVVDQFEELFRFRTAQKTSTADEAAAFVKLLLEASQQRVHSIYVVLTMRSDFLGDCAQFQGLPEAINEGQYLIPRQTRDERRIAVTGPIGVTRSRITEPLVNRLLNDVGDNPDQLPILQHALMRTWDYWQTHRQNGEPIGIEHYEAIGTMSEALSQHADEAFNDLPDDRSRQIAEKLFKALAERGPDNREIRRPSRLSAICEIVDASLKEVIAVIDIFRGGGRSFLMPPSGVPLQPDTVIDLSHESLIRNWQRLRNWVSDEVQSARIYRRLAEAAVLHNEGSESLLQDPALLIALDWYKESLPNASWAERYHPEFTLAINYLAASRAAREAEIAAMQLQREQQLALERRELEMAQRYAEEQHRAAQRLKRLSFALVIISLLALGAAGGAVYAYTRAKRSENQARQSEQNAQRDKLVAEAATNSANESKQLATSARIDAEKQKDIADKRAAEAEDAQKKALAEKTRADEQARAAAQHAEEERLAKENVKILLKETEEAKTQAEKQRALVDEQRKVAEKAKDDIIAEQAKTAEVQKANRLFREASADSKKGGEQALEDAVIKFTEASIAFRNMSDNPALAATFLEIGEIFLASDDKDNLEAGMDRLESAMALYENAGDNNGAAFVASRVAEFIANPANFRKINELEDASSEELREASLEGFAEALRLYQVAKNNQGMIAMLTRMGELSEESKVEGKRDIDFYERTLPLFDQTKQRDKLSAMLIRIGQAYKRRDDIKRAQEFVERAINTHKDASDLEATTDTILRLGFPDSSSYAYADELANMEAYAKRAELLWVGNPNGRADTLRKISQKYFAVCERFASTRRSSQVCDFVIPKALDYGKRALDLYVEAPDRKGAAIALSNLGSIHQLWLYPRGEGLEAEKNLERSRAYYLEALKLFRQESEPSKQMAETLEKLASLTERTNELPQALTYYEEAGNIFVKLNDRRSIRRVAQTLQALRKRIESNPRPATTQPKPSPSPSP